MKWHLDKLACRAQYHVSTVASAIRRPWPGPGTLRMHLLVPLPVLLLLAGCNSSRHLSFLNPQGPIAAAERTHFLWVVGILAVFVALPIFLFVPWVLWRYRYGAKKSRYTPKWKMNTPLEAMTWAGPIVIVIVLSFMTWHYAHVLDPYQPVPANEQTVQIQATGYDWQRLFL